MNTTPRKLLFFLISVLFLLTDAVYADDSKKILAIGDSITQGGKSFTCYRQVLVPALRKRGLNIAFIGPNRDSTSAHAGYGGKNTAYLAGISKDLYRKYPADIVLLHSGHNSFSKDKPVSGIVRDTETIIKNISSQNSDSIILLAQVITSGKLPKYSYIPELNIELEKLSRRMAAKGVHVVPVNQAEGFDWKTDTVADKVHPNKSGAGKMADKWLAALLPLLQGQQGAESRLIKNLRAGKKQVIVAYGTSLTAAGAWVKQVEAALKKEFPGQVTMINSGGSGMWSKWGVENLEKRVISRKPNAVFIEFCINDSVARFNCTVEMSKTNLETMIDRILGNNPECEVILMTTTPGDKYSKGHRSHRRNITEYYEMYRAVAKKRGLMLIDHYPNWKALQKKNCELFSKYVPDTIHPTADGCSEIVTPAILKALSLENPE